MYMLARDCYEVRKEFEIPYVTKQQHETIRAVTRLREEQLLKEFSVLVGQKDAIWEKTKQNHLKGGAAISTSRYSEDVHSICRRVVSSYTTDEEHRAREMKKDF
jgi:hypothetical protein